MTAPSRLDELTDLVLASAKYRAINRDLVMTVGARELEAHSSFKEAVKATKNKLHQVAGAFMDARPRYDNWLAMLKTASGNDDIKTACSTIMAAHASTRERLPILEEFYSTIFAALPPVQSVLDVACGLNPLALPWMPIASTTEYIACDIDHDMMAFVGQCLKQFLVDAAPISSSVSVCNLVREIPTDYVDLALVLKALPTLEQLDRDAGLRLLRGLRADAIVVSFPARSLGGRNKQMVATYGDRFADLAAAEGWTTQRWEFATELAFLVRRATNDERPTNDG